MSVEVITTGNEIMSGLTQDTNFSWVAAQLSSSGIEVKYQCAVADDLEDLLASFKTASKRARFVIVSGGLGPTGDDLSALAASKFLGTPLVFNSAVYEDIARKLEKRGRKPNTHHEKQAMFPEETTVIENPVGTAAGFSFVSGSSKFYFLPGVPREFRRMFSEHVFPDISGVAEKGTMLCVRVLRTFGLGESEVAERLEGFSPEGVDVGYRIRLPEIHLRLTASGNDGEMLDSLLRDACGEAKERLEDFLFSLGDETLEEVTASLLLEKDLTLSIAESCTGGLCSSRFTDIAGSSAYFLGGAVTYSNDSKEKLLGVSAETLERFGAVSGEVVSEMARGARNLFGSDIGLSISGIAGPGGGTAEKPVGTVWFGFTHVSYGTFCERRNFAGTRDEIKNFAAATAIDMVRKFCLDYVG
ncbi:MAG: competence/damage-inducible protein A [Candidatus Dadabacteria bacterium]|nr:competence/damage-inducible protein A [Candidatus Dadabacteria bacterium]MYC40409.1 competence/damage-inducible protein A [Candidatus Dadabacteria bacterium]